MQLAGMSNPMDQETLDVWKGHQLLTSSVHELYTFWENHFSGIYKVWTFFGPSTQQVRLCFPSTAFQGSLEVGLPTSRCLGGGGR